MKFPNKIERIYKRIKQLGGTAGISIKPIFLIELTCKYIGSLVN